MNGNRCGHWVRWPHGDGDEMVVCGGKRSSTLLSLPDISTNGKKPEGMLPTNVRSAIIEAQDGFVSNTEMIPAHDSLEMTW